VTRHLSRIRSKIAISNTARERTLVYGVWHSIGTKDLAQRHGFWEPTKTKDSQPYLRFKAQYKKDNHPKKVGLELITNPIGEKEPKNVGSIELYWIAVKKEIERRGGEVVGLESEQPEKTFFRLGHALGKISADYHLGVSDPIKKYLENGLFPRDIVLKKAIKKINTRITLDKKNTKNFNDAVTYFRSLMMHDKAKQLGCDLIVKGGAHAKDLKIAKKNVHVKIIAPMTDQTPFAKRRRDHFDFYKKLLLEIKKDIEDHYATAN